MYSVVARPHLESAIDSLPAEVAIRIQLSKTNYDKAVSRYMAVSEWIERDGSLLKDMVEVFYPQGSMAIGATTASKLRTDEFDIDVAAQLDLPTLISPTDALDGLFEAINGEPGSRYYGMAERKTRCVTVNYHDDMHLDVTPMLRRLGTPERESWIFNQRPETPSDPGERLIANPYGFAEWFKANTPLDSDFVRTFEGRAAEYESLMMKRADSESVPPQEPPFRKSKAVVVLQLLKRWRNVQYDSRPGRRPPSIMIAKLVADASGGNEQLSDELVKQARSMLSIFKQQHDFRRLIHIVNPVCHRDILTDRWPGSLREQEIFVSDLQDLVAKLEQLRMGVDLDEMQKIMAELFGESPAKHVIGDFTKNFGERIRRGISQHNTDAGRLVISPHEVISTENRVTTVRSTPKNTHFGL